MSLKVTRQQSSAAIPGVQAGLVRNDVNGGHLVIQDGKSQLVIKLSDLVDFLNFQESSKGDSEVE